MEIDKESEATQLFHKEDYQGALRLYSAVLDGLPEKEGLTAVKTRTNILFNRSACHLKLRQFENVLEDCNEILVLEPFNQKALSRKSKVLCSLGRFTEAFELTKEWKKKDPLNELARREYRRLDIIIKALDDQDGDVLLEERPIVSKPDDLKIFKAVNSSTGSKAANMTTGSVKGKSSTDESKLDRINQSNKIKNKAKEKYPKPNPPTKQQQQQQQPKSPKPNKSKTQALTNTSKVADTPKEPSSAGMSPAKSSPKVFPCNNCGSVLHSNADYDNHCKTESHMRAVRAEGGGIWKFRPPPRGYTSKEYSMCPRHSGDGGCRLGLQCLHAHTVDELSEWVERFETRKREMKRTLEDGESTLYSRAEKLLEKWMCSDDPQAVMKEDLEGINVHVSSEENIHMTSKKCSFSWLFTITTRISLNQVLLLDDMSRKNFHIVTITVGPKRMQQAQEISTDCQEWVNPNYTEGKAVNEKVYRVKVLFNTEIFGTFRQSVVFDFGSEPVLVRHLCVDSTPLVVLQKMTDDLILQDGNRWDLSNISIIELQPRSVHHGPEELELLARYKAPIATQFTMSSTLLHPRLSRDNYTERMHCLLDLEEMAQFSSIAKFNIKATLQLVDRFLLMPSSNHTTAKFAPAGELFARLKLNGDLSEDTAHGRLVLQNVSTVYLAPDTGKDDEQPATVYEAFLEEKGKDFVFIRLSMQCVADLQLKKDGEFIGQVQFHLNRLPLCQMHLGVDRLPSLDLVFPDTLVHANTVPWNPQRHWNGASETRLNAKQKEAIIAITTDIAVKLPPILILGPYGTGKTFTLAQATKVILSQENTRVLICTHSNSAADLYIKDYLHPYVEEGHTEAMPLRVYYRHRWVQTVHPVVLQYCLLGESKQNNAVPNYGAAFRHPTLKDLQDVRVVVTTLSTSQYIYQEDMPHNLFTHILLDEAAQAMECESLLPMMAASKNTRVVLAGDHMQLSPEIHSEFARDRDFHMSLLERLYDLYPENHPCKILLCENYRSHKAIIEFTSELFYNNKLIAGSAQSRHETFYPLTFFTARGEEVQHQNSTTFYNNAEVYETVECISELVKQWPVSWGIIDDTSIGVVSPYSDQVAHIRSELRKRKLHNVSVERVLNVQGKQFRVVVLSTVRTRHTCSSDSGLDDVMDYGFLSNAKLLNTAITRAQSLVAVVGDPVSLCTIGKCRKIWERFIEMCKDNNSLLGITWSHLRAQLDGVELKKLYILNPLAPEFIPNRLRHGAFGAPEPVAYGKYGYMFTVRPPGVAPRIHPVIPRWPMVRKGFVVSARPSQLAPSGPVFHAMSPAGPPVPRMHGYTIGPPPFPSAPLSPTGAVRMTGTPYRPAIGTPNGAAQNPKTNVVASPVSVPQYSTTKGTSQVSLPHYSSTKVTNPVSLPHYSTTNVTSPLANNKTTPEQDKTRTNGLKYVDSSKIGPSVVIGKNNGAAAVPMGSPPQLTNGQMQFMTSQSSPIAMSMSPTSIPLNHMFQPPLVQSRYNPNQIFMPRTSGHLADMRPYAMVPQQQQAMFRVPAMYPSKQGVPLQQSGPYNFPQPQWVSPPQVQYAPYQSNPSVIYGHSPPGSQAPMNPEPVMASSGPVYHPMSAASNGQLLRQPVSQSQYMSSTSAYHGQPLSKVASSPELSVTSSSPRSDTRSNDSFNISSGDSRLSREATGADYSSSAMDRLLTSKGTAFFQSLWLQQELYSYMVQTEGKDAASRFMQQMQKLATGAGMDSTPENGDSSTLKPGAGDLEDSSIIAVSSKKYKLSEAECPETPPFSNGRSMSLQDLLKHQKSQSQSPTGYLVYGPGVTPPQTPFTGPYSLQRKPELQSRDSILEDKYRSPLEEEGETSIGKAAGQRIEPDDPLGVDSESESEDPLMDTQHVAEGVVKFLEDSQDEQPFRSQLSRLSLQPSPPPSRPLPLYMRGQAPTTQPMTYAGALRKAPAHAESPPPLLFTSPMTNNSTTFDPFGVLGPNATSPQVLPFRSTSFVTSPRPSVVNSSQPMDPLDILRNLNIKASPATQALYDYFA